MSDTRLTDDPAAPFGHIVLLASLGGMAAFTTIATALPPEFPVPITVVQHRPHVSGPDVLTAALARRTTLPVRVAAVGQRARLRGVTVIPGGMTATISSTEAWALEPTSKEQTCPGDALLTSAADVGLPTIAVILTGHLSDGSHGCRAVKARGGRVLVQDPTTARAPSMPTSAIATGCADFVLPLHRIPTALAALATAPGAADLLAVALPPWASFHAS